MTTSMSPRAVELARRYHQLKVYSENKVRTMIRKLANGIISNADLLLSLLLLTGGMTLLEIIGDVKHITSTEISDFFELAGVLFGGACPRAG